MSEIERTPFSNIIRIQIAPYIKVTLTVYPGTKREKTDKVLEMPKFILDHQRSIFTSITVENHTYMLKHIAGLIFSFSKHLRRAKAPDSLSKYILVLLYNADVVESVK